MSTIGGRRPGPDRCPAHTGAAHKAAPTFKQAAEAFIAGNESAWRNRKQAVQWRNSLETYAFPYMGARPVDAVDTDVVVKALQSVWFTKAETASRVRSRIQSVLDWASARGFRSGDNPARWEGHLDKLLPRKSKIAKVIHHPALPFDELPAFIVELRARPATAARALEFVILTAARTSEALGARWSEIDLEQKVWTIPGTGMKAGREHRVPLTEAAIDLIESMRCQSRGDIVFSAADGIRALSNMALLMMLRRMKREDLTVHGFRSTFRDWLAERTDFPLKSRKWPSRTAYETRLRRPTAAATCSRNVANSSMHGACSLPQRRRQLNPAPSAQRIPARQRWSRNDPGPSLHRSR